MNFFQKVYAIAKQIPYGKVATYGQVAALVDSPRAARQVGYALRALKIDEKEVPWWRIVNKEGYLSINHGEMGMEKELQRQLLMSEGIEVDEKYHLDMEKYRWNTLTGSY